MELLDQLIKQEMVLYIIPFMAFYEAQCTPKTL